MNDIYTFLVTAKSGNVEISGEIAVQKWTGYHRDGMNGPAIPDHVRTPEEARREAMRCVCKRFYPKIGQFVESEVTLTEK